MKRVIERCPNCGVEHDDPRGGVCEVCGTKLRFWCRVHSREIGWLDGAACPGCAAELASRPVPPPRPPAAAPPPPRPRRPAPAPTRAEPEPPVRVPPRRMPRPWGGRDAGVVIRGHAEDIAPYAAAGATFAARLVWALFALVRSVIGWGALGALVGAFYAQGTGQRDQMFFAAMSGAMIGGGFGLLFGTVRALRILFAPPRR